MTEHVITISFAVESEAYQALSALKKDSANGNYIISQVCLVKNSQGRIVSQDGFDTGVETANDTAAGGLVGSLLGILGGPIGVILGGSMGMLVGSMVDAGDAVENISVIERVCQGLPEGKTALIALVQEENPAAFDQRFDAFDVEIHRQEAAEVAQEVEQAQELQRKLERETRKKLREEKLEEHKNKAQAKRDELKARFEAFKEKNFG